MDEKFTKYTKDLILKPGASPESVMAAQQELGTSLPAEYVEFMKQSNGTSGFVGSSYLILHPIDELAFLNEIAGVHEFIPGFIIFGSNGGGTGYCFDTRSVEMPIFDVPFIPLTFEEATVCAKTFVEFLEYLYVQP